MKEVFQTLGVDSLGQKVYLKLLELGPQSISVLAKSLNMPRSSMYVVIDRLKKTGIINEFQKYSIKYVQAIAPSDIENILLKKQSRIHHSIDILHKNMSSLEHLQSESSFKPIINFFEGHDEVRNLYLKILDYDWFHAIFDSAPFLEHYPSIVEMIQKKQIKIKEFVTDSDINKRYLHDYTSGFHEIRILPKDYEFHSDTIITNDSLFMISYDKSISGFQIISPSLVQTQKILFENLWENSL